MIKEAAHLTIEELVREVEKKLRALGFLDTQSDHRVSAIPDARTVRYYTSLGLLDRPLIDRRQALYGSRHVLQLLVIKALQGASMPLSEIQARLYGASDDELNAILTALKKEFSARRELAPQVMKWREVILQPGLKIVAQDGWEGEEDTENLVEQFRAALAALKSKANKNERSGKNGGHSD